MSLWPGNQKVARALQALLGYIRRKWLILVDGTRRRKSLEKKLSLKVGALSSFLQLDNLLKAVSCLFPVDNEGMMLRGVSNSELRWQPVPALTPNACFSTMTRFPVCGVLIITKSTELKNKTPI